MAQKLTDSLVKALPVPSEPGKGKDGKPGKVTSKVYYDSEVKGFGVRVTPAGARSFILNYRTRYGRERRYTIGSHPDWKTSVARDEASNLKKLVDVGQDPMDQVEADRTAKTVADLCDRFEEEHLPKCRESTQRDYRGLMNRYLRQNVKNFKLEPKLKHRKVSDLQFSDIDALHRAITKLGSPYAANRMVAVLSKMLSLAIKWGWRTDNPAVGIDRNQEEKRARYLSSAELVSLTTALAALQDQQAANVIRLLLLTGARRGEVLAARWDQFDLAAGVWTKPGSTTKQKSVHRVPLSAPARQLLDGLRVTADAAAETEAQKTGRKKVEPEFVFPSRGESGHREEIKRAWRDVCVAAGIVATETVTESGKERMVVKPSARIHDLRHTYASVLASANRSLPIIGALLGHSQPTTTARYSHLMDDPLRQATEQVGAIVMPAGQGAEVVQINGKANR